MKKTLNAICDQQMDRAELLGWSSEEQRQVGFFPRRESQAIMQNDGCHRLTFGKTGSGKGVCAAIPELLSHQGNAVVLDVKGELFHVTSGWRKRCLGHRIIVMDPFNLSGTAELDGLSPLDVAPLLNCSTYATASTIAADLCGLERKSNITRGSSNDEFWQNQAASLATGLIGAAIEGKVPQGNSIPAIRAILKSDDTKYNLALMLDKDPPSKPFREEIAAFLQTTNVTRSGILSTLNSHFRGLAGEDIDNVLAKTTFDLGAFVDGDLKATIYLMVPPEQLVAQSKLIRLIFGTLLSALFTRRSIPRSKTLVQLDECAALGEFDPLRTGMTLFRASGVILHALFQDIDQLAANYADAKTIINNAGIIRVLSASNFGQATDLSKLFGMSPQQLLDLGPNEQFLISEGVPRRCQRVNYLQDEMFRGKFDSNPRYTDLT